MGENVSYAEYIGYAVCYVGGTGIVLSLLVWICVLSNRLQHALIETLGGWKCFLVYRDWLADEEHKKFVATRIKEQETA